MPTHPHIDTPSRPVARRGEIFQRARARLRGRRDERYDKVDAGDFVRARLDVFLKRVTDTAVEAEQRFPDLHRDDAAQFALADLLPNRIQVACLFTASISVSEAEHLSRFLDTIEQGAVGQVLAAHDAGEVADVIVQAAEDLHSYLLGHDIVDPRYRHLTAGSLFRRGENSAAMSSRASWHTYLASGQDVRPTMGATAADSHEYALAA